MKRLIVSVFVCSFLFSCSNKNKNEVETENSYSLSEYNEEQESDYEEDNTYSYEDNQYGYSDGTYTAEVDYYNPDTGTSSTYTLDVDVENNELVKIHWNNGGWLDDTHFTPVDISDGDASFTSDRGYEYTVRLLE